MVKEQRRDTLNIGKKYCGGGGVEKEANNEEGEILYRMVPDLTEKMPMKNRVQRKWRIK